MLSVYKPEAEHHCKCVHACVYLYVFVYISAVAGVCVCVFVCEPNLLVQNTAPCKSG